MKRTDTWPIRCSRLLMPRYILNIYVWVENDLFPETNCNHVGITKLL